MKKLFAVLLNFAIFALTLTNSVYACTSFILKAKDGSPVYGRTLEWGIFDFKSNLVMVPRNLSNTANLGDNKQGRITWKNKYGFVAINTLDLPYYVDGMNETGLKASCVQCGRVHFHSTPVILKDDPSYCL